MVEEVVQVEFAKCLITATDTALDRSRRGSRTRAICGSSSASLTSPPPIEDTDDAHGTLGFVLLMLMAVLIAGIMVVRGL